MTEEKLQEVLNNVVTLTQYDKSIDVLKIYAKKIELKILDYTNQGELNAPLVNFLEDKLIEVATFFQNQTDTTAGAMIDGLDVKQVKSIQRGDTTITLKDSNNNTTSTDTINDILQLNSRDCSILNEHRKVRWN